MRINIDIPEESGINTTLFPRALDEWLDDWRTDPEDAVMVVENEDD